MKRTAILILGIGFLTLSGCVTTPASSKKTELSEGVAVLEPQAKLKFSDIPIPLKFKLLTEDSYSFENAGVRVGVLKYQGKADIEQVVNFYKEQMPLYNWNLLNVVEYGERLINFDRDLETCIINLSPKGRVVTITMSLGPKPQNVVKKSKEPVK